MSAPTQQQFDDCVSYFINVNGYTLDDAEQVCNTRTGMIAVHPEVAQEMPSTTPAVWIPVGLIAYVAFRIIRGWWRGMRARADYLDSRGAW